MQTWGTARCRLTKLCLCGILSYKHTVPRPQNQQAADQREVRCKSVAAATAVTVGILTVCHTDRKSGQNRPRFRTFGHERCSRLCKKQPETGSERRSGTGRRSVFDTVFRCALLHTTALFASAFAGCRQRIFVLWGDVPCVSSKPKQSYCSAKSRRRLQRQASAVIRSAAISPMPRSCRSRRSSDRGRVRWRQQG